MKIISWNLWDSNRNLDQSLKLAFNEKPDIICFQEFRKESKNLLKQYRKFDFFFAEDFSFPKRGVIIKCDLVIGIKKEYKASFKKIKMPKKTKKNLLMKLTHWDEAVEFCYVDFEKNKTKFRLFNIHLSCAANPERRNKEIKSVLRYKSKTRKNILCGDLNTFARIHYNFLVGWIFGFRFRDTLCNEQKKFLEIFKREKLVNIFCNKITYPLFGLQLDHIIIPDTFEYSNTKTHKESILYSDHLMVSAVIKSK